MTSGSARESEGAGRVERIWVKRAHRGVLDSKDEVELVAGQGIVDNADLGGKRQVTIIEAERWTHVNAELGTDLDPSVRRANLLVSGIRLEGTRGRTLLIGDCRLLVRGETKPCKLMDDVAPGLMDAMRPEWRGGVYAEVIEGGTMRSGDSVRWI